MQIPFLAELVANAGIGEDRRFRTDTVVFNQRPRTEIAVLNIAKPAVDIIDCDPCRDDTLDCPRDTLACAVGITIVESCTRRRRVKVDYQLRLGDVMQVQFDPRT